jgi:predicted transcriptional regulator
MALKDNLLQGFLKGETRKQEQKKSQNASKRRPRLFDDPDYNQTKTEKPKKESKKSGTQTGTQIETKQVQIEDTTGYKTSTKQVQIGDKLGTVLEDIGDKLGTNRVQIGDKLGTNQVHKQVQDYAPFEASVSRQNNLSHQVNLHRPSFLSLSGIKRKVLVSLYKLCDFSKNLETSPLSLENIATNCNTILNTAKKSLQRLENEGFIKRVSYKRGRGGWTIYSLNEVVYQEIRIQLKSNDLERAEDKLGTNWVQIGDKLGTQTGTQTGTDSPYSSSNLNNNYIDITTTIEKPQNELPLEWQSIDYSSLSEIRFGFPQIMQLFKKGLLTAEQVQSSIDAFAFDIRVNQKDKQTKVDPLRYFIGVLLKGMVYNPPSNYVDPREDSLRKYAESQKKAREKMEESLRMIKDEELQNWIDSLSDADQESFVPEEFKGNKHVPPVIIARAKKQAMREHFDECEWPKIKRELRAKIPAWGE